MTDLQPEKPKRGRPRISDDKTAQYEPVLARIKRENHRDNIALINAWANLVLIEIEAEVKPQFSEQLYIARKLRIKLQDILDDTDL